MTDREALYRAILENPDDDTLRLIYADALEEEGDSQRAFENLGEIVKLPIGTLVPSGGS